MREIKGSRKTPKMLVVCFISLALGGCGGGGDGGAPAPVPTPTPTPSPTYTMFTDFSQSWTMDTPYVEVLRIRDISTNYATDVEARTNLNTQPNAVTISYTGAPTKSVHVDDPFNSRHADFTSADIAYDEDNAVMFNNRDSNFVAQSFGFSKNIYFDNKYVIPATYDFLYDDLGGPSGTNRQIFVEKFLLTGYNTLSTDLPTTGQKIYRCHLSSSTVSFDGSGGLSGTAALTVDFDHSTISGSIVSSQVSWETGKSPVTATLNFSGAFDSTNNSLSGQIASSDSGFTGRFYGSLYGPRGVEMQIIFAISRLGMGTAGQIICN